MESKTVSNFDFNNFNFKKDVYKSFIIKILLDFDWQFVQLDRNFATSKFS